ncbi:MAG TPA: transglycosylase SLT domain-containing protein [Peptococcaceae bacterium]|nr:transglycosylase SLT domain-containing protein [Peptococcaceae bacterium]
MVKFKKQKFLASLLAVILFLSFNSGFALAGQDGEGQKEQVYSNPPLEEIASKLETIARAKGIPSVILKAVAFVESGWRQFDKNGNVLIGKSQSNPSLGIMQITTYDASDPVLVEKLKYDIDFNISYGADLLNEKWKMVPTIGDGDRNKLENWYFALWAYNSWSIKNNPNNAKAQGLVAYQDAVIKKAATEYLPGGVVTPVQITPIPPELIPSDTVPRKDQVWETPLPYTLGDLNVGTGESVSRGADQGSVTRVYGPNRVETANQIALKGWPNGAKTVILTRDDDFPDALAGVPLAKMYNAPILVTNPQELYPSVRDVLTTLKPSRIIILGGESAVSQAVEMQVNQALSWEINLRRIAGEDRFETASRIAREFPVSGKVALATGMDFPDALSLASAAAAEGIPLLLVSPHNMPEVTRETLQELAPREIYLAGGEAAISNAVAEEAAQAVGITIDNIQRFAGKDRYDTSLLIAREFYPWTEELFLATGRDYVEPLASGALAACRNSCLLLVPPNDFTDPEAVENYLQALPSTTYVQVVGGESIISEEIVNKVKTFLRQNTPGQ